MSRPEALGRAAARGRELAAEYTPPDFAHVPDPDAALFLCAIDHRSGYTSAHLVDGEGPFEGSALLWAVGLRSARRRPGLLSARALARIDADEVAEIFRVGGETVADPERRAALWRDLAAGLERDYGGTATELIIACEGRLGGEGGLVERLSVFDAYSDPLAKKSFLFAKIVERRGWLAVSDPERWEVSADNVLMRIALRCGLVEPGQVEEVRPATREAFKQLAAEAGALREPERDPTSAWY